MEPVHTWVLTLLHHPGDSRWPLEGPCVCLVCHVPGSTPIPPSLCSPSLVAVGSMGLKTLSLHQFSDS